MSTITGIHALTDAWVGHHVRITRLDDGATRTGIVRHVHDTEDYIAVTLSHPDGTGVWGSLVVYRHGRLEDWERRMGYDDGAWTVEQLPDLPPPPTTPATGPSPWRPIDRNNRFD